MNHLHASTYEGLYLYSPTVWVWGLYTGHYSGFLPRQTVSEDRGNRHELKCPHVALGDTSTVTTNRVIKKNVIWLQGAIQEVYIQLQWYRSYGRWNTPLDTTISLHRNTRRVSIARQPSLPPPYPYPSHLSLFAPLLLRNEVSMLNQASSGIAPARGTKGDGMS